MLHIPFQFGFYLKGLIEKEVISHFAVKNIKKSEKSKFQGKKNIQI